MSLEAEKQIESKLVKSGFNPYFVGDESGSGYDRRARAAGAGFNPYFVGDESGSR